MKRANIIIKGNVQMAGFRIFIKNIADSVNVKGFAENQEDGSVKVVCEGEEEGINELINSINSKAERLVSILGDMNVTLKSVKEDTGIIPSIEENTRMIPGIKENIEKMLEKQDNTVGAIREVSEKIDRGKEDIVTEISSLSQPFSFRKRKALAEKKKNSLKLKSFFGKAFFFKERFENRFAKIEYEIAGIKAKIGME